MAYITTELLNEFAKKFAAKCTTIFAKKTDIMIGASRSDAGTAGLVPAPGKGKQKTYLRGDGTWQEIQEANTEDIDAIIADAFKE